MANLVLNQEVSDEAPLSLGTTPVEERPERNPVDTAAKAERVAYSIRDPHKDFLSPGSAHAQMAVQSEKMMAVTIAKAEAAYKDKQKLDILNQLASAKAEAGGGPLTPFETDSVLRLTTPELADPRTALERAFASAVVNDTLETKRDDWTGAVSEDPEKADGIASATESLIARQEVGRSLVERATKRSEDQSWLGAAADVAKTIIPTYTAIKYRNQIDLPDNPYFEGETLQRQSQYLWSITDPNEFKRVLEDGYEAMAKDNVVLAKQWLEAVLYGQTGTERTLNNVFTALDVTDVANIGVGVSIGLAKGIARGTLKDSLKSSTSRIAGVARDVAEVMGRHKVDVADTLTAAGNVVDAATIKALKNMDLIKKIETSPTADAADLAKLVTQTGPSLSDPARMFDVGVPTRLTNQMAVRLAEQAERAMDAMSRVLTGINPIARLDEGAKLRTAFTKAQADLLELYPSVRTAVIDSQSRWIYGADTASNVNKIEIAIGRTNGDLFKSEKALRNTFDKYYKLADYRIERIGDKYYGVLTRDVDETARSVMDAPVNADANTPIKPFGYIFDKIRSADALLSKAQKGIRQTLVSSQDELMRQYRIMSEPVQAMSRRERERVSKVLEHNRDFIDPKTNTRGMYYKTINEFDEGFYNINGRVPTRKEREGYFAAIRLNDFDYVLRNVNLYRNRAAMGIENWVYKIGDKYTTDLMGKYVDEIPWFDGHSAKILVIDKDGSTKIVNKAAISDFEREAIQESIQKNGRVVTQVFDQVSRPFDEYLPDNLKGEVITFVVSPRPDRKPLSMQQIPYREGGHVVNDTKFFVKNVNLVQDGADLSYAGDLTFSGHVVEKEAKEFAKFLEEGRRLFAEERRIGKQADRSLLDDFVETNLPFDPDEFRQMFHKGVLNDRGPIVVLKDGQSYNQIADVKETLGAKDLVNSPYSLYDQADRAFTAERGDALYRFKKGEPGNPKWKLETARTLNPIDTLNGALKSAIKSRLYTDYVKRSANEFIQEFGDLLAPSAATLRQNPQYWFYHPQWLKESKVYSADATTGEDISNARLAAAKGMRDAIMHLIDTPTTFRQYFDTAKNRIINTVYDKLGADAAQWVDEKALFRTRDPIRFLRGAAFHSSMGFFNPVQFFLQASTLMHATAISPKHALPAMKDAMNLWISMKNGTPEILAHMKAKSGYKYFDELREELTRSGWMNVGGSTAWLDDALEPNVVSGPASTFLDAATVFFKRGEQMVRAVAYTTAHREWRVANPNAKITDQVRRDLLKRADNLSVNMTRASNAWINNGVMSVPTQFTSFAFRMSEQLLEGAFSGKGALTRAETARVMGMYAMMYGVPTAAAAALGIIPVNKMFEEYAMENGYDIEGDVLFKAFSRGMANVIGDLVIGENTNINERYGPSGSPLIAEILAGEKNVVEAFLGATGSIMTKTWQGSYPLLTSIGNIFTPEEADFPLVPSDFLDAARTISTVENATKAYMAYNWNLWITKNEMQMAEAGGFSALTAVLLGLTPREVTDVYVAKDILKNAGDHRREVGMMVEKEIQRMMRAELDGDAKLAARHLKRAQSWVAASDMSESEKASVFVNAMRGFGTETDEVNLKMLKRSQNKEILDRRIDTMERKAQEKRTAQ